MFIGPYPLLDFIILFGGTLALLMSFTQAIRPNKKFGNMYFCAVFIVIGILMLYFYSQFTRPGFDYHLGFAPPILFLLFSIGPIHTLSSYSVIVHERAVKITDILHGIPAIAAFLLSFIYAFRDPVFTTIPWLSERGMVDLVHYILVLCWTIQFFLYETVFLAVFLKKVKIKDMHRNMIPVLSSVIYSIVVSALLAVAQLLLNHTMTLIIIASLTIDVIVWYIFTYLYPDIYPNINAAIGRYALTHTRNINRSQLQRTLTEIMENEKVYCDEDLTLGRLASMVSVNAHQLSEFINRELAMSFKQYINRYRIDEAKKLLESEPERSILSIGLAVGFNSKSAFYTTFTRLVKATPQAFREEILKKHG